MGIEALIGVLGFMGTLLLVLVGLLNFSVFRKQLRIAKEQIDTAVRQLEIAQKQPDLYLIQRAVTETANHLVLFVERPKLRPYFYSEAEWQPHNEVSLDEIRAMAELILENFERFPFTGLTLLCLKNETRDQIEADLHRLIEAPDIDDSELERRKELLQLYRSGEVREPIELTSCSVRRRR